MEEEVKEDDFLLEVDIEVAEKSRLQWNMLEHNKIPELLPFRYYYRDDKVCFRYTVGRLQPVEDYFKKKKGDSTHYFFSVQRQ